MAEKSAQRRLAAILAADVAGYSRLIERDEAGTLAALKERRKAVLDPTVAGHRGRVVKVMGDGVLVEFGSAVNAVACAVELQKQFAAANEGLAEERRIVLRVGVNLGDVVVEGDDLYGDGVIIAVRLEAMAEPGGICISGSVHEQVAGKLDAAFDDLGLCEIKNSAKPVQVFSVRTGDREAGQSTAQTQTKPSIAVLPFANMSGDAEQQYFSDGITEDIITELSRFRSLFVIARNSSFQYREKSVDVRRVSRELGVRYVVEGSVRKIGNRVRVTVQLIDASSTAHVWGEHYDRELTDIFAIQDEITQMIAARLARQARTAIASRARARPTVNMSAYDFYLRALQLAATYDTVREAEPFLHEAVKLDPRFAAAHAMLGFVESIKFYWVYYNPAHLHAGLEMAKTALQLDPDEAYGHLATGFALLYLRRFRQAEISLDRAVALNPNDPFILSIHAILLNYTNRPEEGLREIDEAQRRDPFAVGWYEDFRGIILTTAGRYREAIACYAKLETVTSWSLVHLTVCYAESGEIKQAQDTLAKLKANWPGLDIDDIIEDELNFFEDPAICVRYRAILQRLDKEE